MLTPGEIAIAVATDAINLYELENGEPYVTDGDRVLIDIYTRPSAGVLLDLRRSVAGLIERGIGVALAQCPVPSPVSDGRIEEIGAANENPDEWGHAEATAAIGDLLRHIGHMHRVMNGPEAEAIAAEVRRERDRCVAAAEEAGYDWHNLNHSTLEAKYGGLRDVVELLTCGEFIARVIDGRLRRMY